MNFVENFFDSIDNHLKEHIHHITCDDIAKIYFSFIDKIDSYSANTRDLTGLTEFIIFRSLYFIYINEIKKGKVELLPNTLVGKREPDLTLKFNNQFNSVISVKSNLGKGNSRLKEDHSKLEEIVDNYPNIKTLTISFDDTITTGQKNLIDTYKKDSNFYHIVFLKNNKLKLLDIANTFVFPVKGTP